MKTKPFLLATAGSTVDGRTIDEKMLKEMASSYDPKTYGARLNIEHIRGISGDKPFRSYGDVLELSTAEVEVNFNGKKENRLALFGTFDVTDDAKALNDAGQKVYPSIEIEENFGGKGFAYLMGCALTDSPASIATDRLQFNRQMPGTIKLSRDESALLEFAGSTESEAGDGLLAKFGAIVDNAFSKFMPKADDKADDPKDPPAPAFDFAQVKPIFAEFTQTVASSIADLRTEMRSEIDGLAVQLKKLEQEREEAPDQNYHRRPKSDGNAGNYAGIF